ncbi:hypothetical protein CERZMDRAFT_88787 [Cercospora zeae-maydis SCOH1-5]|uniref:Uncharacterized protein n=1 Tax=Cercospora zeae-maydis SCOH1-5 TaxID=717836 RepID=A0A6A6F3V8_9PEZI|nr:hypothetical protein CERZMDRAFT_88787 [Cercospora zeae-maydis SCOH1-5]
MGLLRSPSKLLKRKKNAEAENAENPEGEAAATLPPAPSTTELTLRGEREKSQTAYERAQKAEAAYRAKKQAERARVDYKNSKGHLKTSCAELKKGLQTAFSSARSSPAVLKERQHNAGNRKVVKKQEKEAEKMKKLAEKMKKAEEEKAKLDAAAPPAEEPAAEE